MDYWTQNFDQVVAEMRLGFGLSRATSHAVIKVTDYSGPPPAWRPFYSRFTLGERERIRDRLRYGKPVVIVAHRGGGF